LQQAAGELLENAKREVEKMIFGRGLK